MRTLVLSALVGWSPATANEPPATEGAGDEAVAKAATQEATPGDDASSVAAKDGDELDAETATDLAVETVLPCGLRVVTATDASLPVAAVVLAVDVGTRDDPDGLRGLVHTLAYQLQMGNRSLAPGAALAAATDAGGWTGMSVGPTQVRFESLVPLSRLDLMLRVESRRLRAPTVNRALWIKSISYARNDPGRRQLVPRELTAAAWDDAKLAIDGRRVGKQLAGLEDAQVAAQLARLFAYHKASLIVVGPESPEALLARVEPLFADLPAHASSRTTASVPKRAANASQPGAEPPTEAPADDEAPTEQANDAAAEALEPVATAAEQDDGASGPLPRWVELPRQRGNTLVWPVSPTAASRAWAQVLCRTINRQRGRDEDVKSRLRCSYADEERRPTLHLRAAGMDVTDLARVRLARITNGEERELMDEQQRHIAREIGYGVRSSLDLAVHLARSDPSLAAAPGQTSTFRVAELTGEDALAREDGLFRSIPTLLDVSAAVRPRAPGRAPETPARPSAQPGDESDADATTKGGAK